MKRLSGGIDVGSESHHVVVLDEAGRCLYDGKVAARMSAFYEAILALKAIEEREGCPVFFAIEGKNGYGAPFDRLLREAGFCLFNMDNLKLRRFRDVFGADWRDDRRDAMMLARLMRLKESMEPDEEKVFVPVREVPVAHEKLRLLSRHQQTLIAEKVRLENRLTKKLLEMCPDLLDAGDGQGLLRFLVAYPDVSAYNALQEADLLRIRGIGKTRSPKFLCVLKTLSGVNALSDVYAVMFSSYAKRLLELKEEIKACDKQMEQFGKQSREVKLLRSIPGVATKLASRFVGEIGDGKRFANEAELAVYGGVACLDDHSGKRVRTKTVHKANKRCKRTLLEMAGCTIRYVPESKTYYAKKRAEGKEHNHALRCLARQLIKVIFKMFTEDREYVIKDVQKKAA